MDDNETNKYNAGHIVIAAIGGVLAGAAAAILVAPRSGRETRRQLDGYLQAIKDKSSRIPGALRSAGNAAKDSLSEEVPANRHS